MHTEFIYLKDEELISQSGTGFWFVLIISMIQGCKWRDLEKRVNMTGANLY